MFNINKINHILLYYNINAICTFAMLTMYIRTYISTHDVHIQHIHIVTFNVHDMYMASLITATHKYLHVNNVHIEPYDKLFMHTYSNNQWLNTKYQSMGKKGNN